MTMDVTSIIICKILRQVKTMCLSFFCKINIIKIYFLRFIDRIKAKLTKPKMKCYFSSKYITKHWHCMTGYNACPKGV